MKCVSCGAPLASGKDECEHCRTLNDTDLRMLGQARIQSASSDTHEATCPRCKRALISLNINMGENYSVHRCKGCLGTFFPGGELDRLVTNVARGTSVDEARVAQLCREAPREVWPITYVPCPICTEEMRRKRFGRTSGVMVDYCLHHGHWLDGGELGRILTWARAESSSRP